MIKENISFKIYYGDVRDVLEFTDPLF